METEFKHPDAKLPIRAHSTDAGCDIFSVDSCIIEPNSQYAVSTGIAVRIPENCVGLVANKSSVSAKYGLLVGGGVIDYGYTGEVKVILINPTNKAVQISSGQKIAQMLILKIETPEVIYVDKLTNSESKRAEKGFGSTGEF